MAYEKDFLKLVREFLEFVEARDAAEETQNAAPVAEPVAEVCKPVAVATVVPIADFTEPVHTEPAQMSAKAFAEAAGITLQQAYEFARKNEGKYSQRTGKRGANWSISAEAVALYKKNARGLRPAVAVFCKELGKSYASINATAKATGIPVSAVRFSMASGKPVRGHHFSAAV